MSATLKVSRIAAILGIAISAFAASTKLRAGISRLLALKAPGASWRIAAILLALANLKSLPFVWHLRLFRGLFYHIWFQPTPVLPEALFKFSIIRSHAPLLEIDYNLHKSNSTYFSDTDMARTHLVTALLSKGIRGVGKRPGEEQTTWNISSALRKKKANGGAINPLGASGVETIGKGTDTPTGTVKITTEEQFLEAAKKPGPLVVALGSVACFFHREIVPYQKYEIWTRLLTWDRKWMYIVSYFVKADSIIPDEYVLQPWKRNKRTSKNRQGETNEERKQRLRGKVLATSIATYVIKKGRLTIPPEIVLQRSGVLPERPPGAPSAAFSTPTNTGPSTPANEFSIAGTPKGNGATDSRSETINAGSVASILEESLFPESGSVHAGAWTWEHAEKERQRGLRFAQAFDGLNALRDEFDAGDGSVLGVFGDAYGIV